MITKNKNIRKLKTKHKFIFYLTNFCVSRKNNCCVCNVYKTFCHMFKNKSGFLIDICKVIF